MIRSLLVLSLTFLAVSAADAQSPEAHSYWVFFSDKGDLTSSSKHEISDAAMLRRSRRGSEVPAGIDYPVAPKYVAALRRAGAELRVESRWLNAVSVTATAQQLDAIRRLPFVRQIRSVAHLSKASVSTTSSAPLLSGRSSLLLEYGLSRTQLEVANAIPPIEAGYIGSGVRLGFLDATFSGLNHPSLQHLHDEGRFVLKDFTGASQSSSHGLAVVSVAAGYAPGQLVGPAHGAFILGATTEYAPTETNVEEDNFVAGLEWLEEMGADVVNASLGYTIFDPGERSYTHDDLDGDTGVTTQAADRAVSLGITFVVAAGNDGYCSSPTPACWHYIGTPADGDSVIAAGGVTATRTRYNRSSYGPTADGRIKPDVAAMAAGVYVATTGINGYGTSSGTSLSAPMISGVVAQMLQANPALRPMEILEILRQTGSQSENPDNQLGWGIIDAAAAVQMAVTLSVETPPDNALLTAEAYPNPATDYLFIHINARDIIRPRVQVFDVLGRSVDLEDVRYPSSELISLSTSDFSSGTYFYTIETGAEPLNGTFVVVR